MDDSFNDLKMSSPQVHLSINKMNNLAQLVVEEIALNNYLDYALLLINAMCFVIT